MKHMWTYVDHIWNVCGTHVENVWNLCGRYVELGILKFGHSLSGLGLIYSQARRKRKPRIPIHLAVPLKSRWPQGAQLRTRRRIQTLVCTKNIPRMLNTISYDFI